MSGCGSGSGADRLHAILDPVLLRAIASEVRKAKDRGLLIEEH